MPRRAHHVLSILLLGLLLNACGFHLRGVSPWPEHLNPIYLEPGQLDAQQLTLIRNALSRSGASLTNSGESANILRVELRPVKTRRIASSSLSGVELMQLSMRLQYSLQGVEGDRLMASRDVTQSRELELDTNNVLSHQALKEKALQELQQSLIRTMLYQLSQL